MKKYQHKNHRKNVVLIYKSKKWTKKIFKLSNFYSTPTDVATVISRYVFAFLSEAEKSQSHLARSFCFFSKPKACWENKVCFVAKWPRWPFQPKEEEEKIASSKQKSCSCLSAPCDLTLPPLLAKTCHTWAFLLLVRLLLSLQTATTFLLFELPKWACVLAKWLSLSGSFSLSLSRLCKSLRDHFVCPTWVQ